MTLIKKFQAWIELKQELHEKNHKPPYFKEREIWWCSLGENIGSEMNGKKQYFRRPMLVIRKLDRYSFLAVPLTSKQKVGSWYVTITHSDRKSTAVISQIRHIDYRRLDKKMGTLDKTDYKKIIVACKQFIARER